MAIIRRTSRIGSNATGADAGMLDALGAFSFVDANEQQAYINSTVSKMKSAYSDLANYRSNVFMRSYQNEYNYRFAQERKLIDAQIKARQTLEKNMTAAQQQQLKDLKKNVDAQLRYQAMVYDDKAKRDQKEYNEQKKRLKEQQEETNTFVKNFTNSLSKAFNDYLSPLLGLGSFGKLDISGNLKAGNQAAYDFRKEFGTFGKQMMLGLGDSLMNAYKEMNSRGITTDPMILKQNLQQLQAMVNIQSMQKNQLEELIIATNRISENALKVDVTSTSMQYLRGALGTEAMTEMVGRLTLVTDKFENYTTGMAQSLIQDQKLMASVLAASGGDSNLAAKRMEDAAQAIAVMSSQQGASAAMGSQLQQLWSQMATYQVDLTSLAKAAGVSGLDANILSSKSMIERPEQFMAAFLRNAQQMGMFLSTTPGAQMLQSSGMSMGMSTDLMQMLNQVKALPADVLRQMQAEMGIDYTSGEAADAMGRSVAKYTNIDKQNFEALVSGWNSGLMSYEDVTKEGFSVVAGYLGEFKDMFLGFFGKSAGSGIISEVVGQGLSKALFGGAQTTATGGLLGSFKNLLGNTLGLDATSKGLGSLGGLLGKAGPIAMGLALGGWLISEIVGGVKKNNIEENNVIKNAFHTAPADRSKATYTDVAYIDSEGNVQTTPQWVANKDLKRIKDENAELYASIDKSSYAQAYAKDPISSLYELGEDFNQNNLQYFSQGDIGLDRALTGSQREFAKEYLKSTTSYTDRFLEENLDKVFKDIMFDSKGNTDSDFNAYALSFAQKLRNDRYASREGVSDLAEVINSYKDHPRWDNFKNLLDFYEQLGLIKAVEGDNNYEALARHPDLMISLIDMFNNEQKIWNFKTNSGVPYTKMQEYDINKKTISGVPVPQALASGMSGIPYDGFPALLHQGEMVLPAKQANYIRAMMGAPTVEPTGEFSKQNTGNNAFVQSIPEYYRGMQVPGFAAGDDAVNFAIANVGAAYNQSNRKGKDPNVFDCSSLVSRAYGSMKEPGSAMLDNVNKNYTTIGLYQGLEGLGFTPIFDFQRDTGGIRGNAEHIRLSSPRTGDIHLYAKEGGRHKYGMQHVSLVAGPNSIVHAKGTKYGVVREDTIYPYKENRLAAIFRMGGGGGIDYSGVPLPDQSGYGFGGYDDANMSDGGGSNTGISGSDLSSVSFIPEVAAFLASKGIGAGTGYSGPGSAATIGAAIGANVGYAGNKYRELLEKYAPVAGVDPRLLYGMMMTESSGNPDAHRSGSKYMGLMQINQGKINTYVGSGANAYDPEVNIKAAASYLAYCIQKTGSVGLGIAGYNTGPGLNAYKLAKQKLDGGGRWSDIAPLIKTSYISDVYADAGIPLEVPYLEHGGIAQKDSLVRVAEKNKSEAIIPLEGNQDKLGLSSLGETILNGMDSAVGHMIDRLDVMINYLQILAKNANTPRINPVDAQQSYKMNALTKFHSIN